MRREMARKACRACSHVGTPTEGSCSMCGSLSVVAEVQVAHPDQGTQTHTREVTEDDDFDPYLVSGCGDHGIKVVGDRESQSHYLPLVHGCHDDAHGPEAREHRSWHSSEGHDCWSCCKSMRVAQPGERSSGRIGARKQATQFQTNVATSDGRPLLNPGDSIRTPTGQTMRVNQVRRHETSRDHYYLDTDAGTTIVPWSTQFDVVPSNQQQQAIPGPGIPDANTNSLPMNPQAGGASGSNNAATEVCPVCGSKGSLARRGDKYACSRCGYSEAYGQGMAFSDSPQQLRSASLNDPRSVVARRAADLIDQQKETAL